jgi:hypothetical protein
VDQLLRGLLVVFIAGGVHGERSSATRDATPDIADDHVEVGTLSDARVAGVM